MKKLTCLFLFFIIGLGPIVFCNDNNSIIIAGDEEDMYTSRIETSQGNRYGICYAIVRKVAEDLGLKVIYKTMSFAKLLEEADKGNVNAIMPIIKKKERLKFLYFPGNGIWVEENYLVTLKRNWIKYSGDLSALRGYEIGVVKGYSYGKKLDKAIREKKFKTKEYPGNRAVLEDLKKEKIKIGAGNRHTSKYLEKQLKILDLVLMEPRISEDMLYLAFSKKRKGYEALAKKFSNKIEEFRRTKDYQDLIKKYGFKAPTVRLGAENWPPYYGPKMEKNGPITEIITRAFSRAGYRVEIDFIPWISVLEKTKKGRLDGGFAAFKSDLRESEYVFSNPIVKSSSVVFLKKKTTKINAQKIEDLKPYLVGVTRGYIYDGDEFDKARYLNKMESNSEEISITNLIKGRLDLVIINEKVAQYLINKYFKAHAEELEFLDFKLKRMDLHLILWKGSDKSQQLKRDFDFGLKQIMADGTFQEILKRNKYDY